ncbi:hypothetical protein BKA62DRAFT_702290 [Auriculariales sp. MPI-PUGE-AT-0066]|nr:hypothetical protein BKA62DRAFT_702290 [Auriculariales sp. MPI-PUGE-AT-0066]
MRRPVVGKKLLLLFRHQIATQRVSPGFVSALALLASPHVVQATPLGGVETGSALTHLHRRSDGGMSGGAWSGIGVGIFIALVAFVFLLRALVMRSMSDSGDDLQPNSCGACPACECCNCEACCACDAGSCCYCSY